MVSPREKGKAAQRSVSALSFTVPSQKINNFILFMGAFIRAFLRCSFHSKASISENRDLMTFFEAEHAAKTQSWRSRLQFSFHHLRRPPSSSPSVVEQHQLSPNHGLPFDHPSLGISSQSFAHDGRIIQLRRAAATCLCRHCSTARRCTRPLSISIAQLDPHKHLQKTWLQWRTTSH